MVGLNEESFMCNPFSYNVSRGGGFTPRVVFHGTGSPNIDCKIVTFPPSTCEAVHHAAFREWFASRDERVIGSGFGIERHNDEIVYIDYVCSNAYESNIYFTCVAGENKRPSKEMYKYATECRDLCATVYRFTCHAYILVYQKDDSVWCYRVKE
jgi:hypothetical protein